jgi:hypothetical protein
MGDGEERRAGALVSISGTGGQPFHPPTTGSGTIVNFAMTGDASFEVPAKKLLVIEHIYIFLPLPSGQTPYWSYLETVAGGVTNRHRLKKLEPYASPNGGTFIMSEEVTFYADPGSTVTLTVSRAPYQAGAAHFAWSLSGYLVDAP